MRTGDFVEKRQFKRLDLSLPVILRRIPSDGKEEAQDTVTVNVSFNGAYVIDVKDMKPGGKLRISISVPRDETREFPFSRITGKARVMRVEKDGIALEFGEDINRLFVAN